MAVASRRANLELVARWAVPAMLVVFLATIVTITLTVAYDDQDRMVGAATTELELAATVVADDINVRMHDEPNMTPAAALALALPSYALSHGQEVLLSDQTGHIVAMYPATAAVQKTVGAEAIGTVTDVFGTTPPMTIFAERPGSCASCCPAAPRCSPPSARCTNRSVRSPSCIRWKACSATGAQP